MGQDSFPINPMPTCKLSRTQADPRSSIRACMCTQDFCNIVDDGKFQLLTCMFDVHLKMNDFWLWLSATFIFHQMSDCKDLQGFTVFDNLLTSTICKTLLYTFKITITHFWWHVSICGICSYRSVFTRWMFHIFIKVIWMT